MSTKTKRFILPESEIPTRWYNVMADMPNKPMPPLNPATKQPLKASDLYPIFAEALADQEMNQTDPWIDIPDEVREQYKNYRCTPLVRAYGLEKALGTPAHIYFKNESVSPVGSHKLNSALAQAYYCKRQGVTNITTETGAGQWEPPCPTPPRRSGWNWPSTWSRSVTSRNPTGARSCRLSARR